MNNIKKKGVSAVVATVLIIMIVVAAVGILWVSIIPMIGDWQTGSTACFEAISQVSIETNGGYTCRKADEVTVQISRGSGDFVLEDVNILLFKDGNSKSVLLSKLTDGTAPGVNEKKVYTINETTTGFDASTDFALYDKIEIAPIVSLGNTGKSCEVSASVELVDCSSD